MLKPNAAAVVGLSRAGPPRTSRLGKHLQRKLHPAPSATLKRQPTDDGHSSKKRQKNRPHSGKEDYSDNVIGDKEHNDNERYDDIHSQMSRIRQDTLLIQLPNETLHYITRGLDIDSLACLSFTCRVLGDVLGEQLEARCSAIILEKTNQLGNFSQLLESLGTLPSDILQRCQSLTSLYHQWDRFTGFGTHTFRPVNATIMSIYTTNSIYIIQAFFRGKTRNAMLMHLRIYAGSLLSSLTLGYQIPMIRYLAKEHDIPLLSLATEYCGNRPKDEMKCVITILIQDVNLPINECFEGGQTALHIAVCNGCIEISNILLSLGANYRQVNDSGLTPLHLAVLRGYRDIARLLLARYDMIDICEWPQGFPTKTIFSTVVHRFVKEGSTPLHVAASAGNVDGVRLFCKYIARNSPRDDKRKTPLWYAATNRHRITVELLVLLQEGLTLSDEKKAIACAIKENWKPPLEYVTYHTTSDSLIDVTN